MDDPVIRMFLRILAEDGIRLLRLVLSLKLSRVTVQLNRICQSHRLIAISLGFILATELVEDACFGQQILEALLVLDGTVLLLDRLLQVSLVVDEVGCSFVPSEPCVLRQAAKLVWETLRHDVAHIHTDLKGNRHLLPA